MGKEKADKSLHIKCVPGRPLMWKRPPTKRTFNFHLPKLGKTDKSSLNKENKSSKRNNKSKIKNIGLNERSIKQRTNADTSNPSSEDVLQKSVLKDKTNTAKVGNAGGKHILVAVKDLANTQIPVSASKPCEQFETPFLPLLPLTSLQRRLVDTCGSFSLRKSSEISRSTLSTNSDSKITVSNLIVPNKSSISINESSSHDIKHDDAENNPLQKAVSKDASIVLSSVCNVSKTEKSEESANSLIKNVSDLKMSHFKFKKSPPFGMKKESISSPKHEEGINEKDKFYLELSSHHASTLEKSNYHSNINKSEISEDTNDKSLTAIIPVMEEKILNTPLHNDLGQAKRRKITLQKSNIESDSSKINAVRDSTENLNPNIMLISPLNASNLHKSTISSKSNESCHLENILDRNKDLGEKLKLRQLQKKPSSNFVTIGTKRKYNFFENNSELLEKSSNSTNLLHKSETTASNFGKPCNKETKCSLSQELVKRMTEKILKRHHFKYDVLLNDSPAISQMLKDTKQKQPKNPIMSQITELPEKVKALLWKKTSFKRNHSNITDLEVILHIFAKNSFDIRDPVTNVKTYQILKAYEQAVIKDLTKMISETVELQNKQREINKLHRKLNQKGKELGMLVDERHKLCHKIKNEQMCTKK